MASKWPFMVKNDQQDVETQVRFLDEKPSSIFGVMPLEQARAWSQAKPSCDCGLPVSPPRIPVEVKSINGVKQPPRSKYLFLRPVTLNKIMEAIRSNDK
jgi:hypothetical protein